MMDNDHFSAWLGVERLEEKEGYCKLKMVVRKEMCNGFGIAHGGSTFSFADSCFAFASNSYGQQAVSLESSITHIAPCFENDILIAEAVEESQTKRTAVYIVRIFNETTQKKVAIFKGVVFKTGKEWDV